MMEIFDNMLQPSDTIAVSESDGRTDELRFRISISFLSES